MVSIDTFASVGTPSAFKRIKKSGGFAEESWPPDLSNRRPLYRIFEMSSE
jgi:hypothetical protein